MTPTGRDHKKRMAIKKTERDREAKRQRASKSETRGKDHDDGSTENIQT